MVRHKVFCKHCNAANFIDLDDTDILKTDDCDTKTCTSCGKLGMQFPYND